MTDHPRVEVELPPKALACLTEQNRRWRVLRGGRGGGKSWSAATLLIAKAYASKLFVVCLREIQNSLADSVHRLLSIQIERLHLSPWFDIHNERISSSSGSEFIFRGLKDQNAHTLKSLEGADIAWIEEGERTTKDSLRKLAPTIRKRGSEIWITYNPDLETDAVHQMFVVNQPPPRSIVTEINWNDNPWFGDSPEMVEDKDWMYATDPDAAAHVYGGACRTNSEAQVLRGKCFVEAFTPAEGWDGPFFGVDWGFSVDPTAGIRFWVYDNSLWIEHEAYKVGLEIDDTPAYFDEHLPGAKSATLRSDSARPETISYVARHGYPNCIGAEKWTGSVEDGIAFLRSFKRIVIHPRCKHTFDESRLWSYKKNTLGDVTTDLIDANNHCWDAIRYGLEPMIKSSGDGVFRYYQRLAAQLAAQQPPKSFATPTTTAGFPGHLKG